MSQITKIRKDALGLFVVAGGYITRPIFGTCFNEGDVVKSHHFGGSVRAGVTIESENFKKYDNNNYEIWSTIGMSGQKYVDASIKKLKKQLDWYTNYSSGESHVYRSHNEKVRITLNR